MIKCLPLAIALNTLKQLEISWNSCPHGLVLSAVKQLQFWGYSFGCIGDIGARLVSDFLYHNTVVEILNISRQEIGVVGGIGY